MGEVDDLKKEVSELRHTVSVMTNLGDETFYELLGKVRLEQNEYSPLDSIFEDPAKIAINLKTAELIGFDPTVDLLGAADEVYTEIGKRK